MWKLNIQRKIRFLSGRILGTNILLEILQKYRYEYKWRIAIVSFYANYLEDIENLFRHDEFTKAIRSTILVSSLFKIRYDDIY